jgi:DNA polymerase-3 subunit delta
MKFSEFLRHRPKTSFNVIVFVCEDDFLVEESRAVWARILGDTWVFEKVHAKEFEEIEANRLMDEAQTPSLFSQNRALIVANAEKVTKRRGEFLTSLQCIRNSSLKIILICAGMKGVEGWMKSLPLIAIDPMKPGEVARWLVDRYGVSAEVGRHIVESAGAELFPLYHEMEKLKSYTGGERPIEIRDVEASILRVEQFGAFELEDAIFERDYKKAVTVVGAMLGDGVEPLLILSKIVRAWRQLFMGKGLAGTRGANDLALAVGLPSFRASAFAASCRKFGWPQLARGFRELLYADRAFKSSAPDPEAYFDVLLWKLVS